MAGGYEMIYLLVQYTRPGSCITVGLIPYTHAHADTCRYTALVIMLPECRCRLAAAAELQDRPCRSTGKRCHHSQDSSQTGRHDSKQPKPYEEKGFRRGE